MIIFLDQLLEKAIRRSQSEHCTWLVLMAKGAESGRVEEKASRCYFNCMFTPRLWVWNRAKKENIIIIICCCRHSEQLHRVDSLRDTESEITFLCERSLWTRDKEEKGTTKMRAAFYHWKPRWSILSKEIERMGGGCLDSLEDYREEHSSLLWPSLSH